MILLTLFIFFYNSSNYGNHGKREYISLNINFIVIIEPKFAIMADFCSIKVVAEIAKRRRLLCMSAALLCTGQQLAHEHKQGKIVKRKRRYEVPVLNNIWFHRLYD